MANPRLATLFVLAPLALPLPDLPHIRLDGEFMMTGRITAAQAVPGEYVGEPVSRAWNFLALCPAGQCLSEEVVRSRALGGDKSVVQRQLGEFGRWTGEGGFFAPLMCASQVYPLGEHVFFRLKVQITGAAVVNGAEVATSVTASYESYRRTNRTPCVAALGHDAAVYTGTLVTPTPTPAPVPAPTPTPTPGQSVPTSAPG